jgi:hypothetical protein
VEKQCFSAAAGRQIKVCRGQWWAMLAFVGLVMVMAVMVMMITSSIMMLEEEKTKEEDRGGE